MSDLRTALGIVLLVTQAALAIPLLYRLWRAPNRRGISLSGEMIWVIGGFGWGVYAVLVGSTTVLISSVIAVVTSGMLSLLLWRDLRGERYHALLLTGLTTVVLTVAFIGWGLVGLAIGLSVFGALQFIPQLRMTVRHIVNREPSHGVSPIGIGARAGYTFGWSVWAGAGLVAPVPIDWPILVWAVAGTVTFALQWIVAVRSRRSI